MEAAHSGHFPTSTSWRAPAPARPLLLSPPVPALLLSLLLFLLFTVVDMVALLPELAIVLPLAPTLDGAASPLVLLPVSAIVSPCIPSRESACLSAWPQARPAPVPLPLPQTPTPSAGPLPPRLPGDLRFAPSGAAAEEETEAGAVAGAVLAVEGEPAAAALDLVCPGPPPPAPGSSGQATSGGAATGAPAMEPAGAAVAPVPPRPFEDSSSWAAAARAAHVWGLKGTGEALSLSDTSLDVSDGNPALPPPGARDGATLAGTTGGMPGSDRGPSRWCRMHGKQKMCPHVDICTGKGARDEGDASTLECTSECQMLPQMRLPLGP